MPRTIEELRDFAEYLKTNATKSEIKLYNHLVALGIDFKFQHVIQPFIVDFLFPKQKCIVELDSPRFHNKIKDASRDLYLSNAGYRVYRIKSYRVFRDTKNVLGEIATFLAGDTVVRSRKKREPKVKP